MKTRIKILVSIFIFFIVIFLIQKSAFSLINASLSEGGINFRQILSILYHGLPMDMSTSGYLTAMPGLVLIASIWIKKATVKIVYNVYFAALLFLITLIAITDTMIYPYWGFHYDSSILLYIASPSGALASASNWELAVGILAIIVVSTALFFAYRKIIHSQLEKLEKPNSYTKTAIALTFAVGSLFLFIRGGFTTSTMNVGTAYFSENTYFNHSAINPQFNLLYSSFKSQDFGNQFQFYKQEEALDIFDDLHHVARTDSIQQVLNKQRPNIILVMLESFSKNVVSNPEYAPNLAKLKEEAISFNNLYANGSRTDRGMVAIMSGYPSHPTIPIMKYPKKTQSLPNISRSLKNNGYKTSFYYGGDIDFANMRSFLVGSGAINLKDIVSDKDFPIKQSSLSKWGVRDEHVFSRLLKDIKSYKQEKPFFYSMLTLSSHEPFDVPVTKFGEDGFYNSINYTDSCLGEFIKNLKQETAIWDKTLVILVADHCTQSQYTGQYNYQPIRYEIPMLWFGGAVSEALGVDAYASQTDIATTLLSQLGISHEDYKYSKNIFNPHAPHFGLYTYANGVAMLTENSYVIYDNDKKELLGQEGEQGLDKKAKAYLQKMYIDIDKR